MNERLTEKPKGNIAMPGQKISEKWCNKTSRFRSRVGDMSRNKSYSRGTYNEKPNIKIVFRSFKIDLQRPVIYWWPLVCWWTKPKCGQNHKPPGWFSCLARPLPIWAFEWHWCFHLPADLRRCLPKWILRLRRYKLHSVKNQWRSKSLSCPGKFNILVIYEGRKFKICYL